MSDLWAQINTVATVAAALGALGMIWAVYHSRMLDREFFAKTSIRQHDAGQLMTVILKREKIGGHHGKITGLRVLGATGALVGARVRKKDQAGIASYGFDGSLEWEAPVFAREASCNVGFSPLDTEVTAEFWVSSSTGDEFSAHLLISYSRSVTWTRRLAIHAKPRQQKPSASVVSAR